MRTNKVIHIVSCHAEGEVGNVIVGGVAPPPGGLVQVTAFCRNGKAESIEVKNVPSFVDMLDVQIEVEGLGTLTVDTA